MDSYDFGRYMGRPTSPPLPDEHSGGYLPQMPAYSDTSSSGRSSGVPHFGGSVTGYSSASQPTLSRGPSTFHTPEEKSAMVAAWRASGETQAEFAKRAGIPPSSFCLWVKQAGGSSQSRYAEIAEERQAKVVRDWRASGETKSKYSRRTNIPRTTLNEWIKKYENSSRYAR
ncbi:MAG: hypothetical protein P8Y42_20280 [Exilibacterium sp.]